MLGSSQETKSDSGKKFITDDDINVSDNAYILEDDVPLAASITKKSTTSKTESCATKEAASEKRRVLSRLLQEMIRKSVRNHVHLQEDLEMSGISLLLKEEYKYIRPLLLLISQTPIKE